MRSLLPGSMVLACALGAMWLGACGSVSGPPGDAGAAGSGGGGSDAGAGTGGTLSDGGPGDAAETDTPVAAWTPAQLPGLALWLMGDTGVSTVSNKVTTWMDQSGHNNTATQSVAANQPTLVTGVVNGHAVLAFGLQGTSTFLQIADAASLNWGTGDFTVEVVASSTQGANTYGLLYSKQKEDVSPYPGASLWTNYPAGGSITTTMGVQLQGQAGYYAYTAATGLNDGNMRVFGGRRAGMILEARLDGALGAMTVLPSPALDVTAGGYLAYVGAHPTSGTVIQALQGNIAEIVAVGGSITTADLMKLESYLATKYGL